MVDVRRAGAGMRGDLRPAASPFDVKASEYRGVQIALGAALAAAAAPRTVSDVVARCYRRPQQAPRDALRRATALAAVLVIAVSCAAMVSRTVAQIKFYSAPSYAWRMVARMDAASFPQHAADAPTVAPVRACVGSEWHRFSSSFFLPPGVELAFVEFGETGVQQLAALVCAQTVPGFMFLVGWHETIPQLTFACATVLMVLCAGQLPKAFEADGLGTKAAPEELRDRNEKDDRLLLPDKSTWSMWVGTGAEIEPEDSWVKFFDTGFVDRDKSPFPDRAFWIPWAVSRNHVVRYSVLVRGKGYTTENMSSSSS